MKRWSSSSKGRACRPRHSEGLRAVSGIANCMRGRSVRVKPVGLRIKAILNERIVKKLNGGTKALQTAAGLLPDAAPIVISLLDGVTLRAQTVSPDLRFEVASVKLAPPPDGRTPGQRSSRIPGPNNTDPGRFSARLTLLSLVLTAYDIPIYRLSEQSNLYLQKLDIEAKVAGRHHERAVQRDAAESADESSRSQGSLGHPANGDVCPGGSERRAEVQGRRAGHPAMRRRRFKKRPVQDGIGDRIGRFPHPAAREITAPGWEQGR